MLEERLFKFFSVVWGYFGDSKVPVHNLKNPEIALLTSSVPAKIPWFLYEKICLSVSVFSQFFI
jgi:hypothetical protein